MLFLRNPMLFLTSVFAVLLILTLAIPAVTAATSQSSSGYVTYNVTATNSTSTISATVNESITPSSGGFSIVSLQLISDMSNLSYSRLVNSSQAMFPYLPITGNQSFSYEYHNFSISASIMQTGTSSAKIGGTTYPTTEYNFSVSAEKSGETAKSASGQLSTFPSGLIYSIMANYNGSTIQAQLVATNLSLNPTSSSSNTTTMAIIGGTGTLAAGVGAFAFYKRRKEDSTTGTEDKPIYHVD